MLRPFQFELELELLRPFQFELELELLRPFQFELPLLPQFVWGEQEVLLHLPPLWFCQPELELRELPPLQLELPPPLEPVCPCGEFLVEAALACPTELTARQTIPAAAAALTSTWNRRDPRPLILPPPLTAGHWRGDPALVPPRCQEHSEPDCGFHPSNSRGGDRGHPCPELGGTRHHASRPTLTVCLQMQVDQDAVLIEIARPVGMVDEEVVEVAVELEEVPQRGVPVEEIEQCPDAVEADQDVAVVPEVAVLVAELVEVEAVAVVAVAEAVGVTEEAPFVAGVA